MADTNGSGNTEEKRLQAREAKTTAHVDGLLKEKHAINTTEFPIAQRLLDEELQRTKDSGRASFDYRYIDLFNGKPMKVVVRVQFPSKDVPSFNFVGKLLGPKGNTLRQLQEQTKCRMLILGRGSMRDKAKEEELRSGGDPKYAHLSDELHVEVSCVAPPAEAHDRMAYALKELSMVMVPDGQSDEYGGYMEEMPPMMPPPRGGMRGPAPLMGPGGPNSKVMNILGKARHSMDYNPSPPRRFGGTGGFQEPRMFKDDSRGQWVSGYKAPNAGNRFFPPRSGPYYRS